MVPIWRGGKQATRLDEVDYTIDKAESEHGRIVLAFALIIQIVLVWAWVMFLFVNPLYSQDAVRKSMADCPRLCCTHTIRPFCSALG